MSANLKTEEAREPAPAVRNGKSLLLVEDDPGDVRLIREFLKDMGSHTPMTVASNGESALAFLRASVSSARQPRVGLVVLDLHLPGMDGRAVLSEIKSDARLKHLPVIILSTSSSPDEVRAAYALGANCYVTKRPGLEEFKRVVQQVFNFWFHIAEVPL